MLNIRRPNGPRSTFLRYLALTENLLNQGSMLQNLAGLHDSDYRGLEIIRRDKYVHRQLMGLRKRRGKKSLKYTV